MSRVTTNRLPCATSEDVIPVNCTNAGTSAQPRDLRTPLTGALAESDKDLQ